MTEDIPEVHITEVEVGTGVEASKGALVSISYVGQLEDGTEFDSTMRSGRLFQFVVGSNKVIKGMSLAVLGMREGGKRTVLIPSALAYGDRQVGPFIKPNSNLIFHIDLVESRPRE